MVHSILLLFLSPFPPSLLHTGSNDVLITLSLLFPFTHAQVPLSEIFVCEKQLMGDVGRQVSSLRVPITPLHTPLNPHTVTGYLQLVLVLEDHGTVRLTSGCEGGEGEKEEVKGRSAQGELICPNFHVEPMLALT